jgi:hypothetical protein
MPKPASGWQENEKVSAYRELAREVLEIVDVYNARAQWFESKNEAHIAIEYRQLAQEAVARAQRYNSLAELAENTHKNDAIETQEREKVKAEDDLWVAPRHSLKGPTGERAWDNRVGGPPNSSKFLELADIALGLKKRTPYKKRVAAGAHVTTKTERYSK